jgi:hypothetical protein
MVSQPSRGGSSGRSERGPVLEVVVVGFALFSVYVFMIFVTGFASDYQTSSSVWAADMTYSLATLVAASVLIGFAGAWIPTEYSRPTALRPVKSVIGRASVVLNLRSGICGLPAFGAGLILLGSRVASESSCYLFSHAGPAVCTISTTQVLLGSILTWMGVGAIAAAVALTCAYLFGRRQVPEPMNGVTAPDSR